MEIKSALSEENSDTLRRSNSVVLFSSNPLTEITPVLSNLLLSFEKVIVCRDSIAKLATMYSSGAYIDN